MFPSALCAVLILISSLSQASKNTTQPNRPIWSSGIEAWEPPATLVRACPFYQAGYDFEGRPVVVIEFGKWNTRKHMSMDKANFSLYEKYTEKTWWRITQLKPVDPEAEEGVTVIIDLEGFGNSQFSSPALIGFLLQFAIQSNNAEPYIAQIIIINNSFAANVMFNLFRSVSGRLAERAETYGTQASVWKAVLLTKIPARQLPPWYGGKKGFKPVRVFG